MPAPESTLEIQAEGYGVAAERGPVEVPLASERTPLPVAPNAAPKVGGIVSPDGTPINPRGTGQAINLYGEGETPGFHDFATEPRYAKGRPLTSTLPPGSASDLALRDAPLSATTQAELQRLAQPGARITYANANADVEGFQSYVDQLKHSFPNAKIVHQGTVKDADGVQRGTAVIDLP
jgi:hypothetical protein